METLLNKGFKSFNLVLIAFGKILFLVPSAGNGEVNPTVKELMPLIEPVKAADKMNKGDYPNVQERMVRIIEFLERVDGSNGRDGKSILPNAFYIYERDRFRGHRRILTEKSIMQCWEKLESWDFLMKKTSSAVLFR